MGQRRGKLYFGNYPHIKLHIKLTHMRKAIVVMHVRSKKAHKIFKKKRFKCTPVLPEKGGGSASVDLLGLS